MKNKVLEVLDILAPLLLSLLFIAGVLMCAKIWAEEANEKAIRKYNGGICAECGETFVFDGTSGTYFTKYNYHCPSCGETINSYAPMIKTDGGIK